MAKTNIKTGVSNLFLKGMGLDKNGNMTIKVGFPNDKATAIQTNGTLPKTNALLQKIDKLEDLNEKELKIIGREVTDYIKSYGSKNMKSRLKVYEGRKLHVNEGFSLSDIFEDEETPKISNEAKRRFMEMVKGYSKFGKFIYREGNLVEVAKSLHKISELASHFALNEAGDWFDKITVQRNMKELSGLSKDFAKVAQDTQVLQERLSALYEDMGHIINRYYEVADIENDDEDMISEKSDRKRVPSQKRKLSDLLASAARGETSRIEGTKITKEQAIALLKIYNNVGPSVQIAIDNASVPKFIGMAKKYGVKI